MRAVATRSVTPKPLPSGACSLATVSTKFTTIRCWLWETVLPGSSKRRLKTCRAACIYMRSRRAHWCACRQNKNRVTKASSLTTLSRLRRWKNLKTSARLRSKRRQAIRFCSRRLTMEWLKIRKVATSHMNIYAETLLRWIVATSLLNYFVTEIESALAGQAFSATVNPKLQPYLCRIYQRTRVW